MTSEDFRFYLGVLKSEECQCGRTKKKGMAFCYACYRSMPRDIQHDLYQKLRNGFEQAYDRAIAYMTS